MEKVKRSVVVDVPAARVYDYLTDPRSLLEIWPSMVEVSHVVVGGEGEQSFDWTYRMAGVPFRGHADTVEVQRNRLRVVKNESGIPSTFRWTFEPGDAGTTVDLEVDYEVPLQPFGRLAAPFLRWLNAREAETMLSNLRAKLKPAAAEARV